jgi:PAS domain S-box-containing protein
LGVVPTVTTLAVLLVYVLAGKLGLAFAHVHASATPVWPPAGIALAALLLFGNRVWPAIFAGAFVVNVTTAGSVVTSLGIATGNTLEALLGAWLVRRYAGGAAVFERPQDIFKLSALSAVGSTAVSATIGVSSLVLTGYAPWHDGGAIWLTWWLGDASGILLVTPLIVLWARRSPDPALVRRPIEAAAVFVAIVVINVLVFGGVLPEGLRRLPVPFLSLPPLLWAAYRLGLQATSVALFALAGLAVAGTLAGWGPFTGGPPGQSLLLVQAFLATMALTTLPLAAVVSERRRADDAARMREEQLRVAVAAAQMGTWEWTIATGEVRWSASLEAMHGLAPGAFAGTYEAFQRDIHPDDREAVAAAIGAALERGGHRIEYRIVRPDGAVRWVEGRGEVFRDAAGRPERLIGVCVDVSERKRIDERNRVLADIARSISASLDIDTVLPRIADGARALCESDTAAIFLRDEASGAMVPRYRVGPWLTAYETLRIRRGEGLGGLVMERGQAMRTKSYRTDPRLQAPLHATADQTGTVALMVVPILIADDVAGLLYISNRSPREFTDDDEDVSRRLAEQAAIAIQNAHLFAREGAARADAEAASRAKDAFLAMLSHELRNPLGAISNAVHVLERVDGGAAAVRAREIIARQTQHLGRLVDDLLDVSRALSGKIVLRREVVDVAAVVERALAASKTTGTRASHELSLEARPAYVHGDPMRLEQVVNNLLENALKYTPGGGRIRVTVGVHDGSAVLSVEDSGVGIAPELLPKVFDLFVQADDSLDRAAGGLGIGLTLVRRIVELHGGRVEAASAGPGQGSRFTVRLPATMVAPAPAARSVVPANGARRVLVVEDNADAREMLCQLVRLLGHEVHEAADGLGAVEQALRLLPDLTLVDIGLPGMDGYEVARRIRAETAGRHLRLVAVTGYGLREDRERALRAGFDEHLVKPVDPSRLATMLPT